MKKLVQVFWLPALLVALVVWISIHSIAVITASAIYPENSAKKLPVIILDPGHGGFDGGAVGIGDIIEKDINLAISKELYALFTAHGFDVVMTRDSDISLEDEGISTVRKRKNSDIHNRFELVKSFDDAILLSIHQNKFPQTSSFGAQIFYGPQNPQSKQMGELFQARLIEMVDPENTRQAKKCTDSVYLIYNAPVPALLVECGFLSNQRDITMLTDPAYQRKLAFAIFAATCEALELQTPTGI